MVKQKIEELKEHGIIFYLDDFGTGYSNMERILELPFDIIKFDRSLVIASNMDERAGKMIASLANMFRNLDYSVLYEGVEDENDESRCINMSASYLQGYKYSKPIPIKDLHRFFERADRQI
jgi:EAL domain-containing protein (putative c-di-GMP-specific phosphodiesterase class I)